MLVFPNCKINIGLKILDKREDGYHNIETFFLPVALNDAFEIIEIEDKNNSVSFTSSGLAIDGATDNNLCIKAYYLLKKDFPNLPSIKMHLHKNIPMGAGLGGGSADAAFTLLLINNQFKLNLSQQQLMAYALLLGSDCPFFISNKPEIATGRGEILEPQHIDLSPYKIVLVYPSIHVNTKDAFEGLKLQKETSKLPSTTQIISQPISEWKHLLKNDFELPVFKKYPVLQQIKNSFYQHDAIYAAMSGTGSSMYGIFKKEMSTAIKWDNHYFVTELSL